MSETWIRVISLVAVVGPSLGTTASTYAQCTPPATTGPDVVVGDITGPSNYGSVGNYEALSLGTYACNIGSEPLGWEANTNQHPVIGGALFRLKTVNGATRFEQVGTSWLKHGFFAVSHNFCCFGCQSDPTGATLGIHCADPYTAGRNGTQSGLGPRWQVNAHDGSFPFPPPTPSGGNNGRLQVPVSELEATGGPGAARYFGEAMYVAPGDATAGNQNNNASYREVSVSGGGAAWEFGFIGSTQRGVRAIGAWQALDPGVTLNEIQLPGEGLVILGFATTSLGRGRHHYEYAVYNMNSDLAIGSFALPIPAGVTVTNVGFHDFDYLGGDGIGGVNQDGTDWIADVSGGAIRWSTTPYSSSPNANAIRWHGLYNFRFDADAAPVAGTITLGTFKDGGTVTTTGDVPGGGDSVGTSYCFGDGTSGTSCPCSNPGAVGHGCANSANANGALLQATGTTTPDTVTLISSGELSSALTIFLQGDQDNTPPNLFGDGLRCAAGNLKRIGVSHAVGGVTSYPQPGDLSITAKSAALGDVIPPDGTRYYLAYYRDPSTTFCPPETFNSTHGLAIVWN